MDLMRKTNILPLFDDIFNIKLFQVSFLYTQKATVNPFVACTDYIRFFTVFISTWQRDYNE